VQWFEKGDFGGIELEFFVNGAIIQYDEMYYTIYCHCGGDENYEEIDLLVASA
jgi:hypothetical protein